MVLYASLFNSPWNHIAFHY